MSPIAYSESAIMIVHPPRLQAPLIQMFFFFADYDCVTCRRRNIGWMDARLARADCCMIAARHRDQRGWVSKALPDARWREGGSGRVHHFCSSSSIIKA